MLSNSLHILIKHHPFELGNEVIYDRNWSTYIRYFRKFKLEKANLVFYFILFKIESVGFIKVLYFLIMKYVFR